ncbi:hypothetical protein A3D42_03395 [Candidatus Nomurabacteria bacterium RIFCSPHIGHO2_02_FULL_41_18]|uniref:Aminotransferase class I/classII large domain-containing protein n=1 Tax=Candidatus Nomurabacteria bacterium RIFCSPHIGHO2_02_FULL_41_18 TaxID=1801754 RepID=A0A1F6W839_9BACT|nr:MAG: hypothetical protein A3D42_03395 [Candidatus Nomurabacteria bacterium RIFCSPHIGHO2_02_FULL_41_18]
MNPFFQDISKLLKFATDRDIYPDVYTIVGASTDSEVSVLENGEIRKVLMFSSNNYLGLANDERVKKAVIDAVKKYGVGSGGSKLVTGNISVQKELEDSIAEFRNCEDAVTFASGYTANVGTIPAFLNPVALSLGGIIKKKFFEKIPVVYSDEFNHASIVDGCRLAKAERIIYKHKDLNDLESKLHSKRGNRRKLIVTDGVFSMDGDIAPLPGIMELAEKCGATVMIDDAHATGVIGKNGKGTPEYFDLKKMPEIVMGTFTKAFGAIGGFIASSKELVKYLKVMGRPHMFSAPIPPAIVVGILESLEIIKSEKRHQEVLRKAEYMRDQLRGNGFNILESETQIIPILVGDEAKTIATSRELLREGIFAPAIHWPAVPKGRGRLRITVMFGHTQVHLDNFISKIKKIRGKINF